MGKPSVLDEDGTGPDIIGVIGLSGTSKGIITLKFPVETALKTIGRMVNSEFKSVDLSIVDGVYEHINVGAGGISLNEGKEFLVKA